MKTAIFSALAAIASVAVASPIEERAPVISRSFRLKTQVISGMQGFNNQYLVASHTGAGENAPVFTKTLNDGNIGYLNGSTANFAATSTTKNILAFGETEDTYAGWGSMTLNIGAVEGGVSTTLPASSGFSIGPNGYFTHAKGDEFNGWRVCNWVHGVPELFFDTEDPTSSDVPSSCAKVYLVPVYT